MRRNRFQVNKPARELKNRLAALSDLEEDFLLLDSHHHRNQYSRYHWLCGWHALAKLAATKQALLKFREFQKEQQDWMLGHLAFDLKNQLESLRSRQKDTFEHPPLSFFVPQTVVYENKQGIYCESSLYTTEEQLWAALPPASTSAKANLPQFKQCQLKHDYLKTIGELKQELQYGNIYEINYCTELQAHGSIDTLPLWEKLNQSHQAPFSALYRQQDNYLLCFSPERYLFKQGAQLISQPIKGTAPRSNNCLKDEQLKEALYKSEKERAENVMIVDLVRNDLSRTAARGSVQVPELFGVYSFNAVHQMISTVSSLLDTNYDLADVLATSFPMGSMTGAPKISALQLIDAHETFNRSLYSGSVGYVNPAGDCDFNVVIRSILHHRGQQLSSVRVGSAITIHCDAAQEYRECLLKAEKLIS